MSERGKAKTNCMSSLQALCTWGRGICFLILQNQGRVTKVINNGMALEKPTTEGESPVHEIDDSLSRHPSSAEHVKFRMNQGRPRSKAKYIWRPIVKQYREGKVKSTPGGE